MKTYTDEEEAAHQAQVREVIAAVRLAETTDPNIGREWNSRHGRQRIRNRVAHGGTLDVTNPKYEVETIGTHAIRIYSVDRIEDTIERDEYQLTPAYAKELADLEALTRLHQEREAARKAEENAELAEIAKFTDAARMRPMSAGKARNALLKLIILSGVTITLRHAIVHLVASGKTPSNGRRPAAASAGSSARPQPPSCSARSARNFSSAKKLRLPRHRPPPPPAPPAKPTSSSRAPTRCSAI